MRFVLPLLLSLVSCWTLADEHSWFENSSLGFKVRKPNNWYFVSDQENVQHLAKTYPKDKNTALKMLMLKYMTNPLVVMMKQPEDLKDVYPSIKVKMRPLGDSKHVTPMTSLRRLIPQFQSAFRDFKITQAPVQTTVAGAKAAYMRFNYSMFYMDNPKKKGFPLTSEIWLLPRDHYHFMIGAITRQDEKTGSRQEISEILSTMKLTGTHEKK